jgi:hypothetical protein
VQFPIKRGKEVVTSRLKPVTLVKEEALEIPDSESSSRCPTIITEGTAEL